MVRDDGERTRLFDLDQTIQTLAAARSHSDRDVIRLTGIYHNLIRRRADALSGAFSERPEARIGAADDGPGCF